MIKMPAHSYNKPLAPLTEEQIQIRDRVKLIVDKLAVKIGERNIWHPRELEQAADYIQAEFKKEGYQVRLQPYQSHGKTVVNIEAELPGTTKSKQIIVIGAHYDSVFGSPGADDNATGVAALLEIARLLKHKRLACTVRFVAFVNEEPPFFLSKHMGSYRYAKQAHKNKDDIIGMISLDSIGYYSDKKNSQQYPMFLNLFYPDRANYIGFVGNFMSYKLVRSAIRAFRLHAKFPSEGIIAPSLITGVAWSDHWAFWKYDYKAMMITDTAFFRYSHYHTENDTANHIDYSRLARVISGLTKVVATLAN